MPPAGIHQSIHGYREGHRLLSSSLLLSPDSARAMLVLSDMSGPAMQPGFEEYLTGYPLPGSELFVLAKTWYAPEMQRPGCVWTHSLLLTPQQVSQISASNLVLHFKRPQQEGVRSAATTPLEPNRVADGVNVDAFEGSTAGAALVKAVLGQARPVIVAVERAGQLEFAFLRLWEELWPAARVRFSFCTGALLPRSVGGALMDLQAVPRAIPSSQFRKSAEAALVLDLRTLDTAEEWVDLFLDGVRRGDETVRSWFPAAAGTDASRGAAPGLIPIFGAWHSHGSSARSILASIMSANDLEQSTRGRLIGMVCDRAESEAGTLGRREVLHELCGREGAELASVAASIEGQARLLFDKSRADGVALVLALLGGKLSDVGERVLQVAVRLLTPNDLERFGEAQVPFLPAIVRACPQLASFPALWSRVGGLGAEVLSQLGGTKIDSEQRLAVVDAIIASGRDVSVDALIRFGGKGAVVRGLAAITSGQMELSWPWRSALAAQPDTVCEWLESLSPPSLRDLELGSRFVSPAATQWRLTAVWKSGTANAGAIVPRVAAFGLALAFWEADVKSQLLAGCFQPTYDAASNSRLEYDEWEWVREYAPSSSWWSDWDRCERLANAMASMFEKQCASLEAVFGIVHSRSAIKRIVAALRGGKTTRAYLRSLRKAADSLLIGSRDQREALLEDW